MYAERMEIMKDVFCTGCGSKLKGDADFCGACGAPQNESSGDSASARFKASQERLSPQYQNQGQGAIYTPKHKTPASKIVIIAAICLIAASGLYLGAYKLFIKPASSAPIIALKTSGIVATGEGILLPTIIPTEAPVFSSEPVPDTVDYSAIIGDKNTPGITEEQATELFGNPITHNVENFPDGSASLFLAYDTFTLKYFIENGNTTYCREIEITKTPSRISVYGLSMGMGADDVDAILASSPFEINYKDPDGSYCVFDDKLSGCQISIYFADGIVDDIFISNFS